MGSPDSPVLVTGAAGFIGRHVVAALLAQGRRPRVYVRSADRALHLPDGIEVAVGDMGDAAALQAACTGCIAVIHLAAQTRDGPDAEDVNVGGARRLIEACRATACRRVVVVSTQSAKIRIQGDYARTKAAADALFLASGLDVTVMLPSVVYGTPDEGIFGTLRRVVASHRVVPVLGDGRWLSAPVHVEDVAGALVQALQVPASVAKCYDLGGREQVSFDMLLDRIATAQGLQPPVKLHVPMGVALAAAGVLARLMPSPPVTRSNILGSNQDTQIDVAPACRDLGFDPIPLDAGLARLFVQAAGSDDTLEREARALARYLVGADISAELAQRYAAMHARLLPASPDRATAFARRHPWSLSLLDAAAGLRRVSSPLRRRVLLMANVLEASPEHAARFLPPPRSAAATLAVLAWHGVRALALTLLGTPLYLWLRAGQADA